MPSDRETFENVSTSEHGRSGGSQSRVAESEMDALRDSGAGWRQLVENSPDLISILDADGNLLFLNRTLGGFSTDQVVGTSAYDYITPEHGQLLRECCQRVLSTGQPDVLEVDYETSDGRTIVFESRVGPVIQNSRIVALTLSSRDVTERRQAEQALRDSEERLSLVMRATNDGIWDCDLVNGTVWWNEAYTRLFGERPPETSSSWDWWIDRIHKKDRQRVVASIHRALDGKAERWSAEYRFRRKDGGYAQVVDRAFIARDANGRATRIIGAMLDVTERHETEQALQESEAFTRSVLASPVANIAVLDRTGEVIAVNAPWEEFARKNGAPSPSATGVGVNYLDVCRVAATSGDESALKALAGLRSVLNRRAPMFTMEYPCHSETERRWFQMTVTPAQMPSGGLVVSHVSITERKQAEQALRESELRLRSIVNTAADAIVTLGLDECILSFNAAAEWMFGYQSREVIGRNAKILVPDSYREQFSKSLQRYMAAAEESAPGRLREFVARRKDGSLFPVELAVSETGHLKIFTAIIRDISERKSLQEQLLSIAEEEQQRIGQELHDDIGQELTGLGLLTETLADALATEGRGQVELARNVADRIRHSLRKVRALSRGLIPVVVDAEGLMIALRELARQFGQLHELRCEFVCDPPVTVDDNRTATQLYRIAQEAVTNAVKHARAERIEVRLEAEGDEITLTVSDDGIGIPEERRRGPGMGLRTMHHRAGLIGANLSVEPGSACGTLVTCSVALSQG